MRTESKPSKPPLAVLVVEDDPIIASVYKRTVNSFYRLSVAGVVTHGEDALDFLSRRPCDLMLLDLKLAGMNGVTLLRKVRNANYPLEVIVLTACRSSAVVRELVQHGALDYLVKPFTVERLRQALGHYLYRAAALGGYELDQESVDRVCAAGRNSKRWLPKGLTEAGLEQVYHAFEARSGPVSSTDIAHDTGLARVTVRRYLEYLVATDRASVDAPPSGPGRPRKLYRCEVVKEIGSMQSSPVVA